MTSSRSGFYWRYSNDRGDEVSPAAGTDTAFPTQTDAEQWFSQVWQELRSNGVASVTLCHDGAEVYGPMSLDS